MSCSALCNVTFDPCWDFVKVQDPADRAGKPFPGRLLAQICVLEFVWGGDTEHEEVLETY